MAKGKQYPKPRIAAQPKSLLRGKIRAKSVGTKLTKLHDVQWGVDLLEAHFMQSYGPTWRAQGNGTYKDPAK